MKRRPGLAGVFFLLCGVGIAAQSSGPADLVESDICVLGAAPAGIAAHLAIAGNIEVRRVDVQQLQRQLLEQNQVLVYYRDLKGNEPYFKAMQYFGARGFFPLWEAEPMRAVLRGEAIAWLEKLGIQAWDRRRPLETLDWPVLEKWLGRKLPKGEHFYVLRHELAGLLDGLPE